MQIVTPYNLFVITVVSGKPATSVFRAKVTRTGQNFEPEYGGSWTLRSACTTLPDYTVS
jgi:hypothetical protein